MEGPTPVSALIHAATMVAAGVFLIARVYPLMSRMAACRTAAPTTALQVVTWVGAITAVFAAAHRRRAVRHQAHPRLLHHLAARLHDDGPRRRRRGRGHVPPHHPRLLQGAAVPRRRLCHSRLRAESRTFAAWAACANSCPSPSRRMPSECWRCAASRSSSPASGARTTSSTPPTTGASRKPRFIWAHSARCSPPST